MAVKILKQSTSNSWSYNWVFLADWILIVILTTFYVFHISRVIAYVVTKILNIFLWRYSKTYISIEAISISILGGKLHFKNISIVTQDMTISIVKGSFHWRFWLMHPAKATVLKEQEGYSEQKTSQSSRNILDLEGLEIFIYNKSVAYKNIIQEFFSEKENLDLQKQFPELYQCLFAEKPEKVHIEREEELKKLKVESEKNLDETKSSPNFMLKCLPMLVNVKLGALVLGSISTPSVLVFHWKKSDTIIDALSSENTLDKYKIKMTTTHTTSKIVLKPNPLYDGDEQRFRKSIYKKVMKSINNAAAFIMHHRFRQKKVEMHEEFVEQWKGLSMYTDIEDDSVDILEVEAQSLISHQNEYAKYSKILECEKAIHTYAYDVVGNVSNTKNPTFTEFQGPEVGNGGSCPEHRLDIMFYEAHACYGPWANRQLMPIIKMLGPQITRDHKTHAPLSPQSQRVFTRFQLFIDICSRSTLRFPTREFSKDDAFLKNYAKTKIISRPFGWVDVEMNEGSSIFCDFTFYPIGNDFINTFNIDLMKPVVYTSVNHDVFFQSDYQNITAQCLSPLKWSDKIKWNFDLISNKSEAFLLREHITLLLDLSQDFSFSVDDGTFYELFRSCEYKLNWRLKEEYRIYINVNDANVINIATDFDENNYITFYGESSIIDVSTAIDNIAASSTTIFFDLETPFFKILLNTPTWSTISNFVSSEEIGNSDNFTLKGSYQFFRTVDIGNVDQLTMECMSGTTTLLLYGFVIKYFDNLIDNIVGKFKQYRTSEEYQNDLQSVHTQNSMESMLSNANSDINSFSLSVDSAETDFEEDHTGRVKKSELRRKQNEVDIWITFKIEDGSILIPETLYSSESCLGFHFPSFCVDMRNVDYYMDMRIDIQPIFFKKHTFSGESDIFEQFNSRTMSQLILQNDGVLDGLVLHGHRLFGIPPANETYVSKWDVSVGKLMLDSDLTFFKTAYQALSKLGFSASDVENTLKHEVPISNSVEFVTFEVDQVLVKIHEEKTLVDLTIKDIMGTVSNPDITELSNKLELNVAVVALNIYSEDSRIFTFKTSINYTGFEVPADFKSKISKQRKHVLLQDSAYHRCWFLLPKELRDSITYTDLIGSIPPTNSLPSLVPPFVPATADYIIENFLKEDQELCEYMTNDGSDPGAPLSNKTISKGASSDNYLSLINTSDSASTKHVSNDIVIFEKVRCVFDISCFGVIIRLLDSATMFSCKNLADSIQMNIVSPLYGILDARSKVTNINVLAKDCSISIKNAEFDPQTSLVFCLSNVNFLSKEIKVFDPTYGKWRYKLELRKMVTFDKFVARFNREDLKNIVGHPRAFRIIIDSFEYLNDTTTAATSSIKLGTVKTQLNSAGNEMLFKLTFKSLLKLMPDIEYLSRILERIQSQKREFILQVLKASTKYEINYDPPVITKLSNIVRLSKTHVRDNASWRMCIRIRHILNNLSSEWEYKMINVLMNNEFTPLDKASNEFVGTFKKWKNIEQRETCDTYLYQTLFLGECLFKPLDKEAFQKVTLTVSKFVVTNTLLNPLAEDTFFIKSIKVQYTDYFPDSFGKNELASTGLLKDMLIVRADHVKLNFGITTLYFYKMFCDEYNISGMKDGSLQHSIGEISKTKPVLNMKSHYVVNVQTFDIDFSLDLQKIQFKSFDNSISLMKSGEDLSLASSFSNTGFLIKYHNSVLLDWLVQKSSFYYNSVNRSDAVVNQAHLMGEGILVQAKESSSKSLHILEYLIASYKKVIQIVEPHMNNTPSSSVMKKPRQIWMSTLKLSDIGFKINCFSPFAIDHSIGTLKTDISFDGKPDISVSFSDINTTVSSNKVLVTYLLLSQSELTASVLSTETDLGADAYTIEISGGLVKSTIFDLREIGKPLSEDITTAIGTVAKVEKFMAKHKGTSQKSDLGIVIDVVFDVSYFGLLIDFKAYQLIFEIEDITAGAKNFVQHNNSIVQITEFLWYTSIESFKISIKDPSLLADFSRIVDFAATLSVSRDVPDELSSLEMKSNYFRVCFTPQSFIRLFWMYEQFMCFYQEFAELMEKNAQPTVEQPVAPKADAARIEFTKKYKNIQCLSYDFCIGWMYGETNSEFSFNDTTDSGLILGFEKLFSAHNDSLGKLTIRNSYMSVSSGKSYKDFYGMMNNKSFVNKTYLPNIQVAYWLSKNSHGTHDLNLKMSGDLLQVDLLENIMQVSQRLTKSFLRAQKLKQYIAKGFIKKSSTLPSTAQSEKSLKVFGIRQLNCSIQYAGGQCRIYSQRDILIGASPTVILKSPEVNSTIKYIHQPEHDIVHVLRVLVVVGKANNTLYPTCVSLFHQIVQDVQKLLTMVGVPDKEMKPLTPSTVNFDYSKMLKKLDLTFSLTFERQLMSISCEPKAKIKAVLGFEHIEIKAATSVVDPSLSFSVSLNMDGLSSKFQHIFSKNVSSSFSVANMNTVFLVSNTDHVEVYGITKFDKLNMFLDFNQFEDLMLFFDIWTPHSMITSLTTPPPSAVTTKKKFSEKPKRNANTPAFAWNYMSVFENTEGKFDLGPSLGVLTLSSTRVSAALNQFTDWRKKMSLDLHDLKVTSVGRLAGFIELEKFNWTSEIKWDQRETNQFTPMVYLSLGYKSISTKLSLDYHLFLISQIGSTKLTIYNTQGQRGSMEGLLAASLQCEKVELYSTILTTSNILNIYDTVSRIKMDNKMSYFETLRDSNTNTIIDNIIDEDLENYINSLKTDLSVELGELYVQIFQHTLTDSDVLVICNDETKAHISTKGKQKITTQLDMFTNQLSVKMSSNEYPRKDKEFANISIQEYIVMARKASGGTLVGFPSISIQMTTWQSVKSNVVELLYSSAFGGMVCIKWNLRPINFIRDLWSAHAVTLSQRHDELLAAREEEKKEEKEEEREEDENKDRGAASFFEEQNLEKKIKNVNLGDEYIYEPLAEPHIETPKIKDLGGATPPLEWFGVNRKRFPGMVHQVVIVPLQHVISQSEKQYGRALNNL